MQLIDNINIMQSDLSLNENNEPNIWIKLGECADTGQTVTYYQDQDGDGLGSDIEAEYCLNLAPDGWVDNNDDTCIGTIDCLGVCEGLASEDNCGICDTDSANNCSSSCPNIEIDCLSSDGAWINNLCWGGNSIEDNCGICDSNPSNNCVMDCNGVWGGITVKDECGICGGNGIGEDKCE